VRAVTGGTDVSDADVIDGAGVDEVDGAGVDEVVVDAVVSRGASRAKEESDERGFVLAWMALTMVVLLSLAGLALDLAHWYLVANKAQKAADAAALAGAVYLPENTSTGITTAVAIASNNGFTTGSRTTVNAHIGTRPTQLQVDVTTTVDNFFGQLMGFRTQRITRHATAEFERPVPLGSPANSFGNQPADNGYSTNSNTHPGYWANVFGPMSDKSKGDAHQSNRCGGGDDACSSGSNDDYRDTGYYYVVEVTGATSGRSLRIQIYDPAFVHVGDNCSAADGTTELLQGATAATAYGNHPEWVPGNTISGEPVNTHYCTGDQRYAEGTTAPWTTFQVFAPDGSPWNTQDNTLVTNATCRSQAAGGSVRQDFSPIDLSGAGALWTRLMQADADGLYAREVFRQWVTVCTIPDPEPGQYLLRVRTNIDSSGATHLTGGGSNRFSIRATMLGGSGSQVSIHATDAMSMYVSDVSSGATFYLARVTPSAGARFLRLNFFDISDGNGAGNLRINPPTDASVGGVPLTSFSSCTYTPPPSGSSTATDSGCRIPISSSGAFGGQWVEAVIPIPANYDCNVSSAFGCWITISYNLDGSINDTTTWNARLEGDPVRLIE
jgi:hypothetical protein